MSTCVLHSLTTRFGLMMQFPFLNNHGSLTAIFYAASSGQVQASQSWSQKHNTENMVKND